MTVSYSRLWRADGGTVNVSCTNEGHRLVWNQKQADQVRTFPSPIPGTQAFCITIAASTFSEYLEKSTIQYGSACSGPAPLQCLPSCVFQLRSGGEGSTEVTSSQTFTCQSASEGGGRWSPEKEWRTDGPTCLRECHRAKATPTYCTPTHTYIQDCMSVFHRRFAGSRAGKSSFSGPDQIRP